MSKTWKMNSRVSFELTNAMSHKAVTNDDNTITHWLYAGKKGIQSDCAYYAVVETENTRLTANDRAKSSDSPLQVFCSRLKGGSVVQGGYANGKAAFFIEKIPIRIFTTFIPLYRVGLAVETDTHEVMTITKHAGPDDEPRPLTLDAAKWLIELGKTLRVNGKPLDLSGADAKRLSQKMVVDFDAENDESSVDLKVGLSFSVNGGEETDGGVISISEAPAKVKKRAESRKNISRYDDRISFELPKDYLFMDGIDGDGNRVVQIRANSKSDDKLDYKVELIAPDGASARKKVLDILENGKTNADVDRRWRFDGPPKALLIVSVGNSSVFSVQYSILDIRLSLALSDKQALQITWGSLVTEDDHEQLRTVLKGLRAIWASAIVDGKKAVPGDIDIDGLYSAIRENREAKEAEDDVELNTEVCQKDNYIEVGGRWRMELPYGARARFQKRGEDEQFDELILELDRRKIGQCLLGRTIGEQKEASSAIQATLIRLSLDDDDKMQSAFNAVVRDDDDMKVQLGLFISPSGGNVAEIIIEEKHPVALETRMLMAPPVTIDNLGEALQKMKAKEASAEHPFGREWEQYWRRTLRMAASIQHIGKQADQLAMGASQSMGNIAKVCLPKDLKCLKGGKNEADVYAPTDRALTRKDLEHVSQFDYYIMHKHFDVGDSEHDGQVPKALEYQVSMNAWMRIFVGSFATIIREYYSDAGSKAIVLAPQNGTYVAFVCAFNKGGKWDQLMIDSSAGYCPGKLLSVANAIYDSIALDTDAGATIPHAYPLPEDLLHEHYDLVRGGFYTTHRDADFIGQPIRLLMEKRHRQHEGAYDLMQSPDDAYSLDQKARMLAKVFRLEEGLFDPYSDTEAMIRHGMFANARMLHALRSLGWMVMCQSDRDQREPQSYTFEELQRMAEHIENRNCLNYSSESYCSGLCSHYDWHVFYVPDAYIGSDCEQSTDLRQLCGKENRGGNSFHIFSPLLNTMDRTNDIISRCEETLESLEALRKDLADLLPVMQTIHDGFMQDRDRSKLLEGVLAEALTAWCALAIAAKEPFYSEEAADTPEADAGLDGPMERPTDDLGAAPVARKTGTSSKPVAKKPSRPLPAGEVLDLGGATVIAPGQFAGNMTLKNIIIPEGVTEIGEQAFNTCMFLETVVLPKSLKKIGKMAFMSCRSLRQVEIPEGVEEIRDHAFGATNNLKEVYLPDSLKTVDRYIFGLGGDSPYATAYMSGELAKRLQANQDSQWLLSAVSARRYVIDGKGYENMYDYWKPESTGSSGFVHGFPLPVDDKEREKSKEQYRPDMEAAVREGKTLDEMIEVGRKAPNFFRNKEAYENAIKHLDRNTVVTLKDKHFVVTGFGDNEEEVIAEIKKHGGEVHSSMVKKADYLVVCMTGDPGAGKLNKALEWRQKGVTNLIVSDYQLWQAMLGGKAKKAGAKKASPKAPEPAKEAAKTMTFDAFLDTPVAPIPADGTKKADSPKPAAAKKSAGKQQDRWANLTEEDCQEILKQHLSKNPKFVFNNRTFAFCGCGKNILDNDGDSLEGTLQYLGGEIGKGVSKSIDYLVIMSPEAKMTQQLRKAIDYIDNDDSNMEIVMLQDLKQTVEQEMKLNADRPMTLDIGQEKVIKVNQYNCNNGNLRGKVIVPEGVTEICDNGFKGAKMTRVVLPKSLRAIGSWAFAACPHLRTIDCQEGIKRIDSNAFYGCPNLTSVNIQEGVEKIEFLAFSECPNLKDVHLPDSLQYVNRQAFIKRYDLDDDEPCSNITLHMSGMLARYLNEHNDYPSLPVVYAYAYIIDGKQYASIGDYIKQFKEQEQLQREEAERRRAVEERIRQERVAREREEAERKAAEARKAAERERINAEINSLRAEMDGLRGLFAGMKRKKLQKRIDELNEQLRKL